MAMTARSLSAILTLIIVSALIGCAPKDETPAKDASTTPNAASPQDLPPASSPVKYAAVQEIFNENCIGCHGVVKPKQGINLTSYETAMAGGRPGQIIKPGDATGSLLVQVLHGGTNGKPLMPPKKPLDPDSIHTVEAWILAGATKE